MNGKMSFFVGALLVGIGAFILFDNFWDVSNDLLFSLGLVGSGLMILAMGFRSRPPRFVTTGTLLMVLGLYLLLGYYDFIEIHRGLSISMLPSAFAAGLAASCIFATSTPEKLLLAALFGSIGLAFLGLYFGYIPEYAFVDLVDDYWPLVLVLAGLALLIGGLTRRKNNSTAMSTGDKTAL